MLEDSETAEQMPVLAGCSYGRLSSPHAQPHRRDAPLRNANRVDYEMITTDQPLDFALSSFLSRREGK